MAQRITLLPSGLRLTDTNSAIVENYVEAAQAAIIVVDVTGGTGVNLVATVKGFDRASAKSYTILASSTINTIGTTVMRIGPEMTAGANIAKDYIPADWYVSVTHSGAIAATYSVGASLI